VTTQPPRFRLLVGSEEFWEALKADIAGARERVFVQTLSLEGDAAGKGLAQAMRECEAPDRRILVDEFTRWVQNDRFLPSPRARANLQLQAEVEETHRMIRSMASAGVAARWGSPLGFLARRFAWRNHKKLMVIDGDVCYLGGINITEHNFLWHDMMLRIEHPGVTAFLTRDFERSWKGERVSEICEFEGIELLGIDPPDLSPYDRIWSLIAQADSEIFVESAYITIPLSDVLGSAAERGVRVRVLSSEDNNVSLFRRYVTWEAQRHGWDLRFLPGMTHMKALLIDGRTLVMGSANLHFTGHLTQNENLCVVTDKALVQEFISRVVETDWARSKPCTESLGGSGSALRLAMKVYMQVAAFVGRGRPLRPRDVT
jgi:cardiolipin synthase